MGELRSSIFLDQMQPQTLCTLGTWVRGSLPRTRTSAQIIEVSPGLDIEALTDVALKHADVRAALLEVERQFGYLLLHGSSASAVTAATVALMDRLGAKSHEAMTPVVLAAQIITGLGHQHAYLINRTKRGHMALPGESLFVMEMQPAAFAILATNEAEKAAHIKVVDCRITGATGRVYLTGKDADIRTAADVAQRALAAAA